MATLTLNIEDRLVDRIQTYAKSHGTTVDRLISDLAEEKIEPTPRERFEAMIEFTNSKGAMLEGGKPLTREEANERY